MAFVAVKENGTEIINEFILYRNNYADCGYWQSQEVSVSIPLPKGSIKKLIGRDLTWEDEPVELK